MSKTPVYILLAASLLMVAAPTALGHSTGASVSGQCYEENGDGGGDQLSVYADGDATLLTVTGAVAAAMALSDDPEAAANGNGCTEDYGEEEDRDHLAASVFIDGEELEVCYDSEPRTDGSCPDEHQPPE